MIRRLAFTLLGFAIYVGSLTLICVIDGGIVTEAFASFARYVLTPTFAKEAAIALSTILLVFILTLVVAFISTPIRQLREIFKTVSVLYKVTPALALTPILRRAMPNFLSMDTQILFATVLTGLLIGFYPILSTSVLHYEEALEGSPGNFARTVGASRLGAHIYVFGGPLLRGALIGSVTGFPLAVIGVIVGEMIVASDIPNIGYQVMVAVQNGRTSVALGAVLAATLLGLLAFALGSISESIAHHLGETT